MIIHRNIVIVFNKNYNCLFKKMLLKIVFNQEAHLMNYKQGNTFGTLVDYIKEVFKKIPEDHRLVYLD